MAYPPSAWDRTLDHAGSYAREYGEGIDKQTEDVLGLLDYLGPYQTRYMVGGEEMAKRPSLKEALLWDPWNAALGAGAFMKLNRLRKGANFLKGASKAPLFDAKTLSSPRLRELDEFGRLSEGIKKAGKPRRVSLFADTSTGARRGVFKETRLGRLLRGRTGSFRYAGDDAVYHQPYLKPGDQRLYQFGEDASQKGHIADWLRESLGREQPGFFEAGGRWFQDDPSTLGYYHRAANNPELRYIDLPKSDYLRYRVDRMQDMTDKTRKSLGMLLSDDPFSRSKLPKEEFFIPPSFLQQVRTMSPSF